MSAWMHLFALDLAVAALAGLVLLGDSLLKVPGRVWGYFVTAGLLSVLIATWTVDVAGVSPGGAYVGDAWTLFFKRVFLVAGALGTLGAIDWLEAATPRRQAEYYVLILFSLVGMMVLPGARDWILLVVAFELMGLPLAALAAWAKHDDPRPSKEPRLAAEAGLKLFVTSAASTAVTLFGVALVTGLTGTTHIAAPANVVVSPLLSVGLLMVLGGFGFKVGAAPFHLWIPDTYQGGPTPFVAFLSVAPKAGGLAALSVVLLSGWGAQAGLWAPALGVISAASMLIGNFFALPQHDVRRLLGFSGVAQIGYVLIALVAHTTQGLAMMLFFITTYVFTNLGVFFVAHAAGTQAEGFSLDVLSGLSRRAPALGAALLVFLLSLAGIPFVVGVWAKLFVFLAAWRAGLEWLVLSGVALAVVGLFYYLMVARSTFMSEGSSPQKVRVGLPLGVAIAVCLLAVVGLGLWPSPLVDEATTAAGALWAGH